MDPSIWSNLPEQLLERIVACLPAVCLFRFRILSKSWSSFISSSQFLCLRSTMRFTQSPLFLMLAYPDYRNSLTYDPLSDRWYQIPLPSIPDLEGGTYIPFASAGGLICFGSLHSRLISLIVFNPLTRAWRKLPPVNYTLTGLKAGVMVADKDTNSYSVVMAGSHMGDLFTEVYNTISTEVYDSIQDKWKTTCLMPEDLDPLQDTDLCDDIVCDRFSNNSLVAYSLREESWSYVPTPTTRPWEIGAIAQWKGHPFVVGELWGKDASINSICIWELHAPKSGWVKVDTMPDNLCREFLEGEDYFRSVGCNGFFLLYIKPVSPMFLYDISKKLWRRLPSSPLPGHLYHGISYEPALYAAT